MAVAARSPAASWTFLRDAMAEAGASIERHAADEQERREGYRLLTRTLGLGFERFLELADPANPAFHRLQSPYRKFAGDNPDQLYHAAAVSGAHRYRITGRWEGDGVTTRLIELSVYGGGLRFDDPNARRRLVSHLDESALEIGPDGRFEVVASVEPAPGNWLALADDAESLLVRRYFAEPQREDRLPLRIERLDAGPAAPFDDAALARGLIGSGAFLRETVKIWGGWHADVRARLGPNRMRPLHDDGALLTPAGVTYLEGAFEAEPDEALLFRFAPPEAPYWALLPMNVWMESFDWRQLPASINGFAAERDPDGRVTVVMSERDPGLPNWIPLQGHRRGLVSMRIARLPEGADPPEVTVERVPLAALRDGG